MSDIHGVADAINKQLSDKDFLQIVTDNEMAGSIKEYIHTGNYGLDYIISGKADGTGGIPVGRVTEIYGEPGSGKSLIGNHLIKEVQDRDGIAILLDAEGAYNRHFAEVIGVNNDALVYGEPRTIEEVYRIVMATIDQATGEDAPLVLLYWDSIGQTATEHEISTEIEKPDMTRAKVLHSMFRRIGKEKNVSNTRLALVATNHVQDRIGVMFGKKKITPGGRGYKFASSLRLEVVELGKMLNDKKRPVGIESRWIVSKSRIWYPYQEIVTKIRFDSGIDKYSGIKELLVDEEIVKKRGGGWYKYEYEGEELSFRSTGVGEFLEEHPEILKTLTDVKKYKKGEKDES